jgi:L-lactate dehydrogenase complex protein LldG
MSNSREKILQSIQKSLNDNKVAMPFPEHEHAADFFVTEEISVEEKFAQEFVTLGGKFIYCESEQEMAQQINLLIDNYNWKNIFTRDTYLEKLFKEHGVSKVNYAENIDAVEVGVSLCETLVARTGSVILSSAQEYGRQLPVYAPIHIAVAYSHQCVWNISNAFDVLKTKYGNNLPSMISLTTGPSRTADIEKTLVVGVHGPKEVYVFLIDK